MLSQFHAKFPGGCRWRITAEGIEIEGSGLIEFGAAVPRTKAFIARYADVASAAAAEYGVPVELLIACSLTEAEADNPKTELHENEVCVRKEPGFRSVAETPGRISAGMCQLLVSTARAVMGDPAIDPEWLFKPLNSLRACAAYIKQQSKSTGFDPVYAACAYNAGGLYENTGESNRWRLRQFPLGTSKHADRFVQYFNAAMAESIPGTAPRFKALVEKEIVSSPSSG